MVIAAFNQIKAIGVSAQPPGIANGLSKEWETRYAIFLQTLKNQLVQVSDYSLSLEDAESFCHRVYTSHFSGAAFIGGAPGMKIDIDPISAELKAVPAEKDLQSGVILSIPTVFAFSMAFLLTFSVLNLSLSIIQQISKEFFSADLCIRHQPVFQLVYGKAPDRQKPAQDSDGEIASGTIIISLPASAPVSIDLANQQIVKVAEVASSPIGLPISSANETAPKAEKVSETDTQLVLAKIEEKAPQIPQKPAEPDNPKKEKIEQSAEKPAEKRPEKIVPSSFSQQKPEIAEILPKAKPNSFSAPKLQAPTPVAAGQNTFVYQPLKQAIPDITPEQPQRSSNSDSNHLFGEQKICLVPGQGLVPLIKLGDNVKKIEKLLGKPVSKHRLDSGQQVIYRGISIEAARASSLINNITITSQQTDSLGKIATLHGIGIGSSLSEVKSRFGPASNHANSRDLHFDDLGISFAASPQNPEKVGAIKIYRPRTNTDFAKGF